MNYENDFLKYFVDEIGQIYQMIGYCPHPTVILQNVSTKEQHHIVPDAPIAKRYTKLIPEKIHEETNNEI